MQLGESNALMEGAVVDGDRAHFLVVFVKVACLKSEFEKAA